MKQVKVNILLVTIAIAALIACEDGRLRVHERPIYGPGAPNARQIELVPGAAPTQVGFDLPANEAVLIEGKRLYGWYNCSGCHFNGGGGIGPPLMDDDWVYGSDPQNIADTIINGRPQGMPAYGDRIPASHLTPIVAYVRSLSGLGPSGPATPTPVPKKVKMDPQEKIETERPLQQP